MHLYILNCQKTSFILAISILITVVENEIESIIK